MNILYVIGNGFDLSHNIPTKYSDFLNYISATSIGNMFLYNLENVVYCSRFEIWSDFERCLGEVLPTTVIDDALHSRNNFLDELDYTPTDESQQSRHYIDENLASLHNLDKLVYKWINTINLKESKISIKFDHLFKNSSYFITFNYTNTLEYIYKINNNNILHIHGDKHNPVMGHGKDGVDDLFILPELDSWEAEDFLSPITKNIEHFYKSSLKNIPLFIDEMENFISKTEYEIDEIHVIGHSLGEVDLSYFYSLEGLLFPNKWIITYYNQEDKQRKLNTIEKLNISKKSRLISTNKYISKHTKL